MGFHKFYELPFQIRNEGKITAFQFKIIHVILATKAEQASLKPKYASVMSVLSVLLTGIPLITCFCAAL